MFQEQIYSKIIFNKSVSAYANSNTTNDLVLIELLHRMSTEVKNVENPLLTLSRATNTYKPTSLDKLPTACVPLYIYILDSILKVRMAVHDFKFLIQLPPPPPPLLPTYYIYKIITQNSQTQLTCSEFPKKL